MRTRGRSATREVRVARSASLGVGLRRDIGGYRVAKALTRSIAASSLFDLRGYERLMRDCEIERANDILCQNADVCNVIFLHGSGIGLVVSLVR